MTSGNDLDGSALVYRVVQVGNGGVLAECVDTAGDVTYWLLRPLTGRDEAMADHGSAEDADHERLGPPPRIYLDRLIVVPLRCGSPRRDGGRCRNEVPAVRDVCRHHRATSRPTDLTNSIELIKPADWIDPIVGGRSMPEASEDV